MIIVLTGCDKVGKTTLANTIANLPLFSYHHCSRAEGDPFEYFYEVIVKAKGLRDVGENLVCDRFIEGDAIYAEVLGHKKSLNKKQFDLLLELAEEHDLIYVYMWDNVADIKQRFYDCGESYVPSEKIQRIQELMFESATKMAALDRFPVILYNSFSNSYEILSYGFGKDTPRSELPRFVPNAFERSLAKGNKGKSKRASNQRTAGFSFRGGKRR